MSHTSSFLIHRNRQQTSIQLIGGSLLKSLLAGLEVGPRHSLHGMPEFRKFLRLPATEQFLLAGAMSLLVLIRIAVWLLPFKTVQRISGSCARSHSHFREPRQFSSDQAVWATQVASRYVPGTTCLTKALTAQILVGLAGTTAAVRIGVAKQASGDLEAHAWLERGDKILIGGAEADQRYMRLPSFDAEGR